MNLNIGCIETYDTYVISFPIELMNLNIGCIETMVFLASRFCLVLDEP